MSSCPWFHGHVPGTYNWPVRSIQRIIFPLYSQARRAVIYCPSVLEMYSIIRGFSDSDVHEKYRQTQIGEVHWHQAQIDSGSFRGWIVAGEVFTGRSQVRKIPGVCRTIYPDISCFIFISSDPSGNEGTMLLLSHTKMLATSYNVPTGWCRWKTNTCRRSQRQWFKRQETALLPIDRQV